MTKQELIQRAREAILRGEKRVDEWYVYTAKIDLDVKVEKEDIEYWEQSRKAIIEYFTHCTLIDINTTYTDRGLHTVINYLNDGASSDENLNFIQLLLGDDIIRYKINQRRIENGISFDKANILFSKVLHRYPHEESRLKVALERIVGEIK